MKLWSCGFMDGRTCFYSLISLDNRLSKITVSLFLGLTLTYTSKPKQLHQDHSEQRDPPAWRRVPIFYCSKRFITEKSADFQSQQEKLLTEEEKTVTTKNVSTVLLII